MSNKIKANDLKKLIEEVMQVPSHRKSNTRNSLVDKLAGWFNSKSDISAAPTRALGRLIRNDKQSLNDLKTPTFMNDLYDLIKDAALEGLSLDSFGGLLASGNITLDEATNLINSFYKKIDIADDIVVSATGGSLRVFEKAFVYRSLEDIYGGIDKAFRTSFVNAYGDKNRNVERLKKDIENLYIISRADGKGRLEDSDIVMSLMGSPEDMKFLSKFIKTYANESILSDNIENMLQKVQDFRKTYIDGNETGKFNTGKFHKINVALQSPAPTFNDVINASSVLKDAVDKLVTNLVRSVAGMDQADIDKLTPISENANEFEIEDMKKFFNDDTKKTNADRDLKSKIKTVFDQANNWADRNIPDELSILRAVIKRKIDQSVDIISQHGTRQAKNDLQNPAFGTARADLSVSNTPDFNLGDLYNVDNKSGRRLQNTFEKLTTLGGDDIFRRIKTLESFLPSGGQPSSDVPSLGSGKISNFLAGAAISKLVVDYFGSGASQEIGYDFENFLSMLLGGNRSGTSASTTASTTMGTFDIAIIDPATGSPINISAKSVKPDNNGRLFFTQAMSNINGDLSTGKTVPYIIALKDKADFDDEAPNQINVDFYALELYVLPGQTITNDNTYQKDKIGVRPYKAQHTGITQKTGRPYGPGQYNITKAESNYQINLDKTGVTPFAKITVPTKQQFQQNAKTKIDSFDADLTKIFSNMRKLKNNVEDFLMGDDSTESLAKASTAADAYIELQTLINSTFFMKDQDLQLQDPEITDRTNKMGRVGVKGDLEKVTSESLITANFLKKLIEESFKK